MLNKGFTIIELTMVILIVGIVAIMAMTDLISSVNATRLEAARWKLTSDIIYAQRLAVTQQTNHGVVFNPAGETYSVYRLSTATIVNDPLTGTPFTVNYSTDPNFRNIVIVSTSFGAPTTNQVEFNSIGLPSDGTSVLTADGTVTLGAGAATVIVTVVENTGKVN